MQIVMPAVREADVGCCQGTMAGEGEGEKNWQVLSSNRYKKDGKYKGREKKGR